MRQFSDLWRIFEIGSEDYFCTLCISFPISWCDGIGGQMPMQISL